MSSSSTRSPDGCGCGGKASAAAGAVAFAPTPTMVNETQYSFDGYPTVWQSAVMSSADHSAVFSALAGATRRAILARP